MPSFRELLAATKAEIREVDTAETEAARRSVCRVAGLPMPRPADLQPPAGQHPNSAVLARSLAEVFESKNFGPVLVALEAAGVPCAEAPAADSEIFLADPIATDNGMVAVRQHPKVGALRVSWQPVQFARTAPSRGLPTPLLGEHTADVLREVGYSDGEIAALHADGTVRSEGAPT